METTAADWPGFRASFTKAAWNKNGWTKEDWRKAAHERAGALLASAHQARLRKMMHAHIAEATAAAAPGAMGATQPPWTRADGPRGERWPGPGHHGRGRGPWGFGGPPFPGPWFAGGGRPRPRRGDVRLAVLTLLAEQPMPATKSSPSSDRVAAAYGGLVQARFTRRCSSCRTKVWSRSPKKTAGAPSL